MGADALFGRYWAADSPIHRLDPRTKFLGALFLVITLFVAQTPLALGFLMLAVCLLFVAARIPLSQALRSIAPLLFIVILTGAFNLFFVQGGTIYVNWGWITISEKGIYMAAFIIARLTLLLLVGSLLTLTTETMLMADALERLLMPFSKLGLPAHEFAFVLSIALHFLPTFVQEFNDIRIAQISRGARFSTSPIKGGFSSLTSLLVPLFASVFRHADTLSAALDSRCYHGAQGRTSLHPLRFTKRDAGAAFCLIVVLAAVLVLNCI